MFRNLRLLRHTRPYWLLAVAAFEDGEFALEAGHLGTQVLYLVLLLLNDLFLGTAVVEACGGHALADAALLHKVFVLAGDVGAESFVHHVAEADGAVGHFLVRPTRKVGHIDFDIAVCFGEVAQTVEAGLVACGPLRQVMVLEVVHVVLQ